MVSDSIRTEFTLVTLAVAHPRLVLLLEKTRDHMVFVSQMYKAFFFKCFARSFCFDDNLYRIHGYVSSVNACLQLLASHILIDLLCQKSYLHISAFPL